VLRDGDDIPVDAPPVFMPSDKNWFSGMAKQRLMHLIITAAAHGQ